MKKYTQSEDGYIVYEDGGISPIAYGASEIWFRTYDEAMEYAISIVKKRVEELKMCLDANSVIVYEGPEELLRQTHSVPGDRRVVFAWNNYKWC